MYPPTAMEGLGALCVADTSMDAAGSDFAVFKLRYGAGLGVSIVSEAWTCLAATANLF